MVGSRGTHTVLSGKAAGGTLRLVHPRWADFEAWAALRRENADYLRPWEPYVSTEGLNRPAYRGRLSRLKKLVQQDRAFPFHIFRGENLVGACNITHIERGTAQSAKLGYWIGESFTGRGFARASVRAASARLARSISPEACISMSLARMAARRSASTTGYNVPCWP